MVGGGRGAFIGAVHRLCARMDGRYDLVAGALSSAPERARDSGADLGLASDRIYTSYGEMAAAEAKRSDGIEAVSIVTPNDSHHAIARAFLDRGIDVICDKPMTTTVEDALDLAANRVKPGVELLARVDTDVPPAIIGDPARLRQVFVNVLDNAIKYTPEGGAVEVRVGRRGAEAVATVRDTGAGIPAEHLPHVFDRFYRVDRARSRAEGGTGLGLAIARSIVEAHGGRIALESTPGRGTACTVTLPPGGRGDGSAVEGQP
jgi:signal transduction histidine kinase